MYLAFYGLDKEPFRLSPDPKFLHLAAPHRGVLEAMLQGVSSRKGLQVCVGPVGTGKTTLLYCLQRLLLHESTPERPMRTAFIVNPVLSVMEFFEALFDDLEVAFPETKPRCLRELHRILAEAYARNGVVLIIVDEAHLLSAELIEEIRLLMNLDNYPANVLQILLCGQPELFDLLAKPQFAAFRQRVSIFSQLRALSLPESRAYIMDRLRVAGLRLENPFSDAAVEEVHQRSQGVPRVINVLCDRALSFGRREGIRRLGPDAIKEVADPFTQSDRPIAIRDSGAGIKVNAATSRFAGGGYVAAAGGKP